MSAYKVLSSRVVSAVRQRVGLLLIGQGLNFLAMILPIVLSSPSAIVLLVSSAAIATAINLFLLLALPARYPSIVKSGDAHRALAASVVFAYSLILLFFAVFVLLKVFGIWVPQLAGAALLSLGLTLDSLAVTCYVRLEMRTAINTNRLLYGVINITATTLIVLTTDGMWSLVIAGTVTYIATAILTTSLNYHALSTLIPPRDVWVVLNLATYVKRNVLHASGYLLNGIANQAPNLFVAGFGILAASWATTASVAGGVGSLVALLIVPRIDIELSRCARLQDWDNSVRAARNAILQATILGVVAVVLALSVSFSAGYFKPLSTEDLVILTTAVATFWVSAIAVTAVSRSLSLIGAQKSRTVWDVVHFLAIFIAVAIGRSYGNLLLAIVTAAALTNLLYLGLLMSKLADRRKSRST